MVSCCAESDYLAKLARTAVGHDGGDHFERSLHLADPSLFGPTAPAASQQRCTQGLLYALVASSTKAAGFTQLPQHSTSATANLPTGLVGFDSPLVILLRRVSSWYWYHMTSSPPAILLQISRECELLFRLLTPHGQLAIMTEIVTVLSSPALALQKE